MLNIYVRVVAKLEWSFRIPLVGVLTRIGFGSKAVITGDVTQIDLGRGQKSGLIEAQLVLAEVRGISFVQFQSEDVVRHPLVGRIVNAYEEYGARVPDSRPRTE